MTITIKPGVLASHARQRGYARVAELSTDTGLAASRLMSIDRGDAATMAEASRLVIGLDASIRETFYYSGAHA